MKAKVLKYKFDGNTVVAPYMELEAYAENIYLSLSDKNEYGNENYDYFHVVCKVENIYFSCGQYSREMLGREKQKQTVLRGGAGGGGAKRKTCQVLQKLDREYASGCGKREPCLPFVDPCF